MARSLDDCLTRFTINLYKKLKSKGDGRSSIVCCPFSIAAGLCMTLAGARHNTAKQIMRTLRVQGNTVHASFAHLLTMLSDCAPHVTLHIASRLYSERKYGMRKEFEFILQKFYGSTIERVDFKQSADEVCLQVNAWVKEATRSKIKAILPKGSVNALTSLILVDAVYFKGLWSVEFDPALTSWQEFYETAGRSKTVDMMFQNKAYRTCRSANLKARAVEIPYKGHNMSMVIVLPDEVDGLEALEESLTPSRLTEILGHLTHRRG